MTIFSPAERLKLRVTYLRDEVEAPDQHDLDFIEKALDQALAAERQATVERIRHATILPEKWLLTSDGKEWVDAIPVNDLVAILDAEADR